MTTTEAIHWIEPGHNPHNPYGRRDYVTAWCSGPAGTFMLNAGHKWTDRGLAEKFLAEHHHCVQQEVC